MKKSRLKFKKTWNASTSLAAAAKKLGLKPRSASTIASALRREGAKLKRFTAV